MSAEWLAAIVALISGAGIPTAWRLFRLTPPERALTSVEAAAKAVATQQLVNDDLVEQNARARARADYWKHRCLAREQAMEAAGMVVRPWVSPPDEVM